MFYEKYIHLNGTWIYTLTFYFVYKLYFPFQDVDLETLHSSLSEEGYLIIQAELKAVEKAPEKTIEIKFQKTDAKTE